MEMSSNGWMVHEVQEFAKEIGANSMSVFDIQVEVTVLTCVGATAAVAPRRNVSETQLFVCIGNAGGRVIDARGSQRRIRLSTPDDLVERAERSSVDWLQQTFAGDGLTWNRKRA